LAVLHALGVEHAAQDVVAHTRKVLHAAAADHHHRVFLQIVAFTRNVADYLEAIGQTHFGDLAQRRIRLLWRGRVDAGAHATLLRALLQRRNRIAAPHLFPRLADQLVDRRHSPSFPLFADPPRGLTVLLSTPFSTNTTKPKNERAPSTAGAEGRLPS